MSNQQFNVRLDGDLVKRVRDAAGDEALYEVVERLLGVGLEVEESLRKPTDDAVTVEQFFGAVGVVERGWKAHGHKTKLTLGDFVIERKT